MASELTLIVDMVTVLGAATAGGYIANRLRQPTILGYLLGGMAIGPAGLHLVTAAGEIQVMAEIGVALLLFSLGVEFSFKELLRVKAIAFGGGALQILLTIALGAELAYATGWVESIPPAIFLGAVLSLSSTAVVLKSLIERNEVRTPHGQVMLAMLVVQDLGLGVMLAVLPALTQPADMIVIAVGIASLKAIAFLGMALMAGRWLIPSLVRSLARSGSQELFLLGILVLCLGIALLTSTLGLGIAMGAFVAGLTVSNVEYADHALDRILPMRDVFATLFFASIGVLIDPSFLLANIWSLAGLVAVAMLGKALIVGGVVKGFGYSPRTAITVGLGINQIGEFSFVLSGVAQTQGLFSDELYGLTVGTTAATLLMTPFLLKITPDLLRWLDKSPFFNSFLSLNPEPQLVDFDKPPTDRVVVAGFGRVGQTLVRMLYFQGYQILVIDNDEARLQTLRDRQIPYIFGDASSQLVLEKANLESAKGLAIALPDPLATRLTLKRALSLAPDLDVTVRAHAKDEIDILYQLGAQEVVQPEFEASLEMGAHMLLKFGDSTYAVQQVVNRYRRGRYRDIQPERSQYWGDDMNMEAAVEGFERQWYTIESNSPLLGHSLAQANVRRRIGVTVMAFERGKKLHRYPTGDYRFELGDRLLVVGNSDEHTTFKSLLLGLRSTDSA
ncbi:MAG: sodium:calcium exchanger [Coleofasciculaceae cyanobacterium RL_1_1]|nr:sodium:calcium exchanger [Coleofasciculaceae cyanobacterium RL_1_1]